MTVGFRYDSEVSRCAIAAVVLGGAILVEPSGKIADIACRKPEGFCGLFEKTKA
jgi:hypothetical protein